MIQGRRLCPGRLYALHLDLSRTNWIAYAMELGPTKGGSRLSAVALTRCVIGSFEPGSLTDILHGDLGVLDPEEWL